MTVRQAPAADIEVVKAPPGYVIAFQNVGRVVARDRRAKIGLVILVVFVVVGLIGPYITPYPVDQPETAMRFNAPSLEHPFGTDRLGRDVFSRTLAGVQVSLLIAFGAVLMALVSGVLLGAVAGFAGGAVDSVIMRLMDAIIAFPGRLLAIALVAAMGASVGALWFALAFSAVPEYARLVRGTVLGQKERDYTEAARSIGEPSSSVLLRYVLPNSMTPILVRIPLNLGQIIIAEAGLSFLGLGIVPPLISWGRMLSEGQEYLETAPWMAIFPGLALSILILGFVLFGDALRDHLDPRAHSRRRRRRIGV
jgi:peptide/nickel transport system permease protein